MTTKPEKQKASGASVARGSCDESIRLVTWCSGSEPRGTGDRCIDNAIEAERTRRVAELAAAEPWPGRWRELTVELRGRIADYMLVAASIPPWNWSRELELTYVARAMELARRHVRAEARLQDAVMRRDVARYRVSEVGGVLHIDTVNGRTLVAFEDAEVRHREEVRRG